MDNIINPNTQFDFSRLSLAHPISVQGGSFFTKIEYMGKPLYIQTSKSLTRQGFVKSGKKYYCDLMFDINASENIAWFEKLEEVCHKLIFEKSTEWFQGTLDENDVDTAFNPVIRIYKSGKYYLVRTNVKNNSLTNEPIIKIYDENENAVLIEDVKTESNIISILEISGIKFTTRNFQIEIDVKQVMVLDKEPLFSSCLIKTDREPKREAEAIAGEKNNIELPNEIVLDHHLEEDLEDVNHMEDISHIEDINHMEDISHVEEHLQNEFENKEDPNEITLDIEDLNLEELEKPNNNIEEVVLEPIGDASLETIKLKKPNEIYYEIYREARKKAKEAKKSAIIAYLEAKNIKKTYMLESMNDSDSDFDAEIEEVSESELEGL